MIYNRELILKETIIRTTRMMAGRNVKVIMEGFAPRVHYNTKTKQPTEIVLPALPANPSKELVDAIHGYLDHESAHILYSNGLDICDPKKDKLWHYVHNMIDDNHINAKIHNDYPGCYFNLKNGYNFIFNKFPGYSAEKIKEAFSEDKDRARTQYAMIWVAKRMGSPFVEDLWKTADFDEYFKEWDNRASPALLKQLSECNTSLAVRDLTDVLYNFFNKEEQEQLEKMAPELKNSKNGDDKEKTSSEGEDESESAAGGTPVSFEEGMKKIIKDIILPEFEQRECIYWSDRMNEIFHVSDISSSFSTKDVTDFDSECKRAGYYVRKRIERFLESKRRAYYVTGFKTGKMMGKKLYSVPVGNEQVFGKKTKIRAKQAAVSLLCDLSGSMNGSKVELACKSAYAVADCLEKINIPFECLGFWNDAGHKLNRPELQKQWNEFQKTIDPHIANKVVNRDSPSTTIIFKDFNENFGFINRLGLQSGSKSKIGMANNEDSTHVKIALERLAARPEENKILIVFSDGQPAFSNNQKNSCSMLSWLAANAKSLYGVDVIGIGIQSNSVTNFYKENRVIKSLEELPNALFETLSSKII